MRSWIFSIQLQRNHLIRIKNGEDIDDSMILMGCPYNDLAPQKAFELYENADLDYILLDVSSSSYNPTNRLKGAIQIPLEDLGKRYSDIHSKTTPIMIISETGLRSIQACELLVKKGYFNINNISGGYAFWPAFKSEKEKTQKPAWFLILNS